MTKKTYRILACPYCPGQSRDIYMDGEALHDAARQTRAKRINLLTAGSHCGILDFGEDRKPCPHIVHTEIFFSRGSLRPNGLMRSTWSAEFRHQHPLVLELDADGTARNFLFENLYLQQGPLANAEYQPRTPHTVTGWTVHRFSDDHEKGNNVFVDVEVHAFFAQDVAAFLRDLRQLAEAEQLSFAGDSMVCIYSLDRVEGMHST